MPRRSIIVIVAFHIVVLCCPSPLWAGTQPIVTTDLLRIRTVTSIDVAKDGSRAVFAVRSIASQPVQDTDDPLAEPTHRYQSHLFLVDLSDPQAAVRQLTFGERRDGVPKFSPDGRNIAFVRDAETAPSRALSKKPSKEDGPASQVWLIAADGGEARQLTNFQHGCSDAQWSPDGGRILVSSSIPIDEIEGTPPWPMERPNRTWKDAPLADGVAPRADGTRQQIRAWLERNAADENPNVINRIEFQDEQHLRGPMRFAHLFAIDPDAPNAPIEQLAARQITTGFYDHQQAAFMPDGKSVVYAAKKPVDQHIDRVLATSLWRVDIENGHDRLVLALDGWTLESPQPSRDGAVIAFSGQRMDEPAFRQTQLGIASIKGETVSEPVWLTDEGTFMGSVRSFEWMQLQPALAFTTGMRGGFPLMTVSPGLIEPATLVSQADGMPVGVHAFGIGGGAVVYSVTSASNPCVLKIRDGRGERVAYDLNPWVAEKNLSLPVGGEITRPDGTKVQYWLMEPINREPGKKYPLVLEIHGGPSAMWGPGEFTMWHEFQLLCSWGFGVVYSNPRGSGGYGYAFQHGNFQDWGEGPGGDALAAVDQAALKDWVDQDRLVITGGSYAGYLTVWIIAHDRRFKAAVAQRGVYDFETFFGEGNAWRLVGWAMGGPPHDARFKQVIERNNPMNFVTRIKTPLLIKHASEDLRTGVSQSEMLYRALKDLGQPVEYVRYPGEGHDLSRNGDPLRRMDRLNRMIEWFERWVENPRTAPVATSSN
ncbi:MAG: S9 family peptidase [Phycisphaerales bacterium]|nr:S9 family peptidase [Phycisphaerales bacterium]